MVAILKFLNYDHQWKNSVVTTQLLIIENEVLLNCFVLDFLHLLEIVCKFELVFIMVFLVALEYFL